MAYVPSKAYADDVANALTDRGYKLVDLFRLMDDPGTIRHLEISGVPATEAASILVKWALHGC